MRIVDGLKRFVTGVRKIDPVFGPMLFMGKRAGYWECRVELDARFPIVEAFVDGSRDDSMEGQRAFFEQFLRTWPDTSNRIAKFLVEKWENGSTIERPSSAWDAVMPSSISIPNASIDHARWQMTFATLREPRKFFTVDMEGLQPQQLSVDD